MALVNPSVDPAYVGDCRTCGKSMTEVDAQEFDGDIFCEEHQAQAAAYAFLNEREDMTASRIEFFERS